MRSPQRRRETTLVSRGLIAAGAALLVTLAGVSFATASDTQWWIMNQASDLARAETHGVIVGADGAMRLGQRLDSWPADSLGVIWAIAPLADGSVALAGDDGRIDRWTADRGVHRWVKLPVGQVLSLATDGRGVVAGTGPEGLVYRVGAAGDTSLLARTGERYVWGLAPAGNGAWFAATGTHGRLFRLEGGHVRLIFDSDESNLVSILADGHGGVYVGGDSRGHVIHVGATGAARTLCDVTEDEVRALAFGPDGALYAAALSASAMNTTAPGGVTIGASMGGPASAPAPDDDSERPSFALPPSPGGRAVLYRIVPDSSVATWWTCPQPALFALASDGRGLLAATGNRAGLYRVTGLNAAAALLTAAQGQITALAIVNGAVLAAGANPAVLWRMGPSAAARGELTSSTLDAHRMARFGHIVWHGSGGKVGLATRSGNTDPPDTTWSTWAGAEADPDGIRIEAPPGRYLQWRLTLTHAEQEVTAIEASWREINQPPRIEEITVAPQGSAFREGELQPRMEPVTQTLSGGQKVEYSLPSASTARGLRALPAWARGLRTVQWRASDPNGDPLRFTLERRAEGSSDWIKMADKVEASAFTWDTNPLPDGRYRLRVTASDSPQNSVGEERTGSLESAPFTIDNTPPRVKTLTAVADKGGVRIEGEAVDDFGRLSQLDVAVDEEDWRPLTADGGLTDSADATFHAWLAGIAAGEHTVSVRASDLAGNSGTRSVRVTVARAR